MNANSPVLSRRAERIRELERTAESQRELFRAQLDDLADAFRPVAAVKKFAFPFARFLMGRLSPEEGIQGIVGSLLTGALPWNRKRSFPWMTALVAGASITQVVRWAWRKHHAEHGTQTDIP